MNRLIKTSSEYESALREIEALIDTDIKTGSPEADELDVLTLLVKDYENKQFPVTAPSPVEAIKFRMDQQNLSPRDLIPYIGSRSKVSEVLSGKRPLTLAMIRALNTGLGIPAQSLIRENELEDTPSIEWDNFPVQDMLARGYFGVPSVDEHNLPELLSDFFKPFSLDQELTPLYRKAQHIRSAREMDDYALMAWTARVVSRGLKESIVNKFDPKHFDADFISELVHLSVKPEGPKLAAELLSHNGVTLVVEPHLPHTYIDGACMLFKRQHPIIGLTLRYDRLDNFWFTLLHELGHLILHFSSGITEFVDDLDFSSHSDSKEREADNFASQTLIPEEAWKKSPASKLRSPDAAQHLAKQLGIHPAIVAGRMRKEFNAYRLLNNVIGHGHVRKLFPSNPWKI